jgi:pimeloyl-ACP methyl ester carboxylesterase
MASPTPKNRKQGVRVSPPANHGAPEVVDPVWLVKAIGLTIVAALICGYLTLCLLFYQGQWQLVLHPSRSTPAPASIAGAPFETVRFGVDESALPQLTGWWIPAPAGGRYAQTTILYLPAGDGSLADSVGTLATLHSLGVNVFAFDYRGYGQSAATRPNQARMTEDTASAWQYLTVSRAISGDRIVPFGDGVGAALAAGLAGRHAEVPAVVLEAPRPDLLSVVRTDPRTTHLPVGLLFHDRFEIDGQLAALHTPKLLLLADGTVTASQLKRTAQEASTPKTIVHLENLDPASPLLRDGLTRFFDTYLRP